MCVFFGLKVDQLMVSCWFGLVVWDSNRVPLSNNAFHKEILFGIQTTGPPNQQLTISWVDFLKEHLNFWSESFEVLKLGGGNSNIFSFFTTIWGRWTHFD